MDKDLFRHTLRKYLEGNATDDEKALIEAWYKRMEMEEGFFENEAEEVMMENRYWSRIKSYIRASGNTGSSHWRWYSVGLVASALLIAIAYFNFGYGPASDFFIALEPKQRQERIETIVNNDPKPQFVSLPDGSEVVLEPKSRMLFSTDFSGSERRVFLNGMAFFNVVRDDSRPFKVVTPEVITRVLGTSFTVSAFGWDKDVTVSVVTGRVSVYKKNDETEIEGDNASEVILTPNQKFVYHKEERKITTTIVNEPKAIVPTEEVKRIRLEDTTPKEVFEAIERVYGVEIIFDEERFSTCRITTNISDGNILNRLLIICEVINATYRVDGTKIVIEGEGCNGTL